MPHVTSTPLQHPPSCPQALALGRPWPHSLRYWAVMHLSVSGRGGDALALALPSPKPFIFFLTTNILSLSRLLEQMASDTPLGGKKKMSITLIEPQPSAFKGLTASACHVTCDHQFAEAQGSKGHFLRSHSKPGSALHSTLLCSQKLEQSKPGKHTYIYKGSL